MAPQDNILCLPILSAWSKQITVGKDDGSRSITDGDLQKPEHAHWVIWMADISRVLHHQCKIIHILFVFSLIFLFKVLSDKALPVLCLFAILVYWTLGLSLPSTDNLLEEDVSECVSLF